jgi:hypothetical protein
MASCGSTGPDPSHDGLSVLFVGNSLTAANDLPGMVARLAEAAGVEQFTYQEISIGGASLEDHWTDGRAVEAIESARWDIVVLQQGPSSLESSRVHLIEWAGRFAQKIRERGGRPALYMVWPPRGGNWDGVTQSYTDAAVAVDGLLFPAGEAVRAVDSGEPGTPMFQADGFHPSPAGSYLAALVFVGALTRHSTEGLSLIQPLDGLSSSQLAALEQAADQANREFGIP